MTSNYVTRLFNSTSFTDDKYNQQQFLYNRALAMNDVYENISYYNMDNIENIKCAIDAINIFMTNFILINSFKDRLTKIQFMDKFIDKLTIDLEKNIDHMNFGDNIVKTIITELSTTINEYNRFKRRII